MRGFILLFVIAMSTQSFGQKTDWTTLRNLAACDGAYECFEVHTDMYGFKYLNNQQTDYGVSSHYRAPDGGLLTYKHPSKSDGSEYVKGMYWSIDYTTSNKSTYESIVYSMKQDGYIKQETEHVAEGKIINFQKPGGDYLIVVCEYAKPDDWGGIQRSYQVVLGSM